MIPVKTITIYRNESNHDNFHFESADVINQGKDGKNDFIQKNRKPMLISELSAFSKAYNGGSKLIKYFEEPAYNVIYANFSELEQSGISKTNLELIWFSPKGKKNLFFPQKYSIKTGQYYLPTLVWKYYRGQLNVYACMDDYPTAKSVLYRSPFANVYRDSNVCMGTTVINLKGSNSVESAKNEIEKGFFKSVFDHFHVEPFIIPSKVAYQIMSDGYLQSENYIKLPDLKIKNLWHLE